MKLPHDAVHPLSRSPPRASRSPELVAIRIHEFLQDPQYSLHQHCCCCTMQRVDSSLAVTGRLLRIDLARDQLSRHRIRFWEVLQVVERTCRFGHLAMGCSSSLGRSDCREGIERAEELAEEFE